MSAENAISLDTQHRHLTTSFKDCSISAVTGELSTLTLINLIQGGGRVADLFQIQWNPLITISNDHPSNDHPSVKDRLKLSMCETTQNCFVS